MTATKRDLKNAIRYWAKDSYKVHKDLRKANEEIKRLNAVISELKHELCPSK